MPANDPLAVGKGKFGPNSIYISNTSKLRHSWRNWTFDGTIHFGLNKLLFSIFEFVSPLFHAGGWLTTITWLRLAWIRSVRFQAGCASQFDGGRYRGRFKKKRKQSRGVISPKPRDSTLDSVNGFQNSALHHMTLDIGSRQVIRNADLKLI